MEPSAETDRRENAEKDPKDALVHAVSHSQDALEVANNGIKVSE